MFKLSSESDTCQVLVNITWYLLYELECRSVEVYRVIRSHNSKKDGQYNGQKKSLKIPKGQIRSRKSKNDRQCNGLKKKDKQR
jgi:hypothetical protein